MSIQSSELITNDDGSIFHLHLLPEDLADTVILVGDPGRVETIATYFDSVELKKSNREFYTLTGTYKNRRLSVLSTGIGPDNIDIVINELDALVNIDLKTKEIRKEKRSLNIVRIGTSGSVQTDIPVNSFVISEKVSDAMVYFVFTEMPHRCVTRISKKPLQHIANGLRKLHILTW